MDEDQRDGSLQQWEGFCAARPDYVRQLADVVEQSVRRKDTFHPVFCGCIDWHSSVHGTYALLTAARITGQAHWAEVVDTILKPDCLDAECRALLQGTLEHELPYGFAWFLRLAREREEGWGKTDLRPLATEIARRLASWLMALSDEAVIHHVQRREYGNLSWPLLNLWEWGKWNCDVELINTCVHWTRSCLLPLEPVSSFSLDQATDEFFAPALQRCRAVFSILPAEEAGSWWASCEQGCRELSPLTMFPTVHSAGLNFSRSWGLWTVFEQTGDLAFRDLYVRHILTHMDKPEYWRDDYRQHGHWVPQFGIYAIALSMKRQLISGKG